MADYVPPVAGLLTLGVGEILGNIEQWPNYPEDFGFGQEDIPELIRLATDMRFNLGEADQAETWAPTHAWRALGQLRAEAAVEPLLQLLDIEDDDCIQIELPLVYGLIGLTGIAPLAEYMSDRSHALFPRVTACQALENIGNWHEIAYYDAVRAITEQLQQYNTQNPEFNGFLINALIQLGAVEVAPLMEEAFAAKRVDPSIIGDWDEVQASLGLISYSELQRRRFEAANRPVVDFATVAKAKSTGKGFGGATKKFGKKPKRKR